MVFLRKYSTETAAGTHLRVPMVVVSAASFANSSNWTPASGDVYISKDGGALTAINSLPVYVTGAWTFALTSSEISAKTTEIQIIDHTSKAVEDQFVIVETFGNASAMYPLDYSDSVRMGLTALPNAAADAAGGLPISDAGGLDMDGLNTAAVATQSLTSAVSSKVTQVHSVAVQINSRASLISSNGVAIIAVTSKVTAIGSQATAIKSQATQIDSRVSQIGVAGAGLTDLGGMSTTMKAQVNSEAWTAVNAFPVSSLVWDTIIASHVVAGTTGYTLNAAGAAGDPWSTALPGAYGAGTAGKILGTNLDLAISTRQPSGAVIIQGTKTTLDSLQDISKAAVNSEVYAAVGSLGYTPTRAGYLDSIITRQPSGAVLIQGNKTTLDSLQDISATQVYSKMVQTLAVDTYTEPGQGAPPATTTIVNKLGYTYKAWRNRTVVTSTNITVYADDGTTADQKLTHSDTSSGYDRGEMGTGA